MFDQAKSNPVYQPIPEFKQVIRPGLVFRTKTTKNDTYLLYGDARNLSQVALYNLTQTPSEFFKRIEDLYVFSDTAIGFNPYRYELPLLSLPSWRKTDPQTVIQVLYQRHQLLLSTKNPYKLMKSHPDLWTNDDINYYTNWLGNHNIINLQPLLYDENVANNTVFEKLCAQYDLPLSDVQIDNIQNQIQNDAKNLITLFNNHYPIHYGLEYNKRHHIIQKYTDTEIQPDISINIIAKQLIKERLHIKQLNQVKLNDKLFTNLKTKACQHLAKFYQYYDGLNLNNNDDKQKLYKIHQAQLTQFKLPIIKQANHTNLLAIPSDQSLTGFLTNQKNEILLKDIVDDPENFTETLFSNISQTDIAQITDITKANNVFKPSSTEHVINYKTSDLLAHYLIDHDLLENDADIDFLNDLLSNIEDYDHDYLIVSNDEKYSTQDTHRHLLTTIMNELINMIGPNTALTLLTNVNLQIINELDSLIVHQTNLIEIDRNHLLISQPDNGLKSDQIPNLYNVDFYASDYIIISPTIKYYQQIISDHASDQQIYQQPKSWPKISAQLLGQYLSKYQLDTNNLQARLTELLKENMFNPKEPSNYNIYLTSDYQQNKFYIDNHNQIALPILKGYYTKNSTTKIVTTSSEWKTPDDKIINHVQFDLPTNLDKLYVHPDKKNSNHLTINNHPIVSNNIVNQIDYKQYIKPVYNLLRSI